MRLLRTLQAALLLFIGSLHAQIPYTGGPYSETFDGLPGTGAASTIIGPRLSGGSIAVYDLAAYGLPSWVLSNHAGTGANALFGVGNGSGNAGAVLSYGATGNADRALGSLASGAVASRFGVTLINSTSAPITQLTVSYTGEQWRRGSAAANVLSFSYALGAVDLNTGAFVSVSALDFIAPSTAGSSIATVGNDPAFRTALSSTLTGLQWAPGQTLTLRWSDLDNSGSDDGLAIDDLVIGEGSVVQLPELVSTMPASGASAVSSESPLVLNFSAPVNVAGPWFSLVGSNSGTILATVTGGPQTFTLTPTPPFSGGESVTLTVFAAGVSDAATGTLHPAADETVTFTVASNIPVGIHAVQGSGTVTPLLNQIVTVRGVVTASFQGVGGLGGFYLQSATEESDNSAETSEGVFVFNQSFPVTAGEYVQVTGRVVEFGNAGRTQTEITSVLSVTKLGFRALPDPIAVELPFASLVSPEKYEGMRVALPQTLTVTDTFTLGRFGEVTLSVGRLPNPTNVAAPGVAALNQAISNLLNQIVVDDGVGASYLTPTPYLADSAGLGITRRAGSTTTGVVGILDEKFGGYIIEPTEALTFNDANPRTSPPPVQGSLRVVGANVLNYFNGDGLGGGYPTSRGADTPTEFERQRAKIIAAFIALAPDILGVTEMENDGASATSALADLVRGLNAAAPAGTTYAYIASADVDATSDEIANALIYRVETVEPVGLPAALNHPYFLGLARSPVAQTFREKLTGAKLTVCINHFKSKGSVSTGPVATDGIVPNPNLDQNDGQGNSNYVRTRQAQALVSWLATDPTDSGDPDFLIIGDLNAYAKEDPIRVIENAGYINLTEVFEGVGGYSYSFNGEFGHLDHALATDSLTDQVAGAATWHLNADEPIFYDYNTENKSADQLPVNVGTAFRYSDHDPVIVGLSLTDAIAPTIRNVQTSASVLSPANHKMVPVTLTVDAVDNLDPSPVSRVVSVTSNQPANDVGDGNTEVDWIITGNLQLQLRAERSGKSGERVYTIVVESRDAAGNVSTSSVTVKVPR
ncbi:MAG: ExeM/NucH family extracellular endonuclease [Opitutaceae bacterium]